jgi:geranylgeranyl diphosphate synthase type II
MSHTARIERALEAAVAMGQADDAAPGLAAALRYAVFPGGARVRPQLCLAVSAACGGSNPELADAAAASIELLHCASLVHDDLPCFDDADLRRGKPTVHAKFGVPLALLTGDALIVMAFEVLARAGVQDPARLPGLISCIARGVGAPYGIVAGQAWECETSAPFDAYHQAKTGALFVAATTAGALAAGADPAPWRALGEGCNGQVLSPRSAYMALWPCWNRIWIVRPNPFQSVPGPKPFARRFGFRPHALCQSNLPAALPRYP